MNENILKLWMPVMKASGNKYVGILSDTSLDRDEEFMTRELLETWADTKALPALANHDNRMEMLVGGWKNLKTIKNGEHTALVAEPFFLESNPLAQQIKAMVEEAIEKGLNVGISIGAIPSETVEKEINGKKHKGYSKAELIEATWVPLQSNRNAFAAIAKRFNFDVTTKPKDVEDCVRSLMGDPEFKPKEGRTKEESAWAVCQSKVGKTKPEGITMTQEEQKKKEDMMEEEEEEDEDKKKPKKSSELQEAKEAALEAQKAATKCTELFEKAITQLETVTKELSILKNKSVNLPKAEGPLVETQKNIEPTLNNMLKGIYGGK